MNTQPTDNLSRVRRPRPLFHLGFWLFTAAALVVASNRALALDSENNGAGESSQIAVSADGDDAMSASPAGDELLLFSDLPVVISAARRTQPINLSAVPISIIDADDIHYSGLTNIPELLQFVPGVDVLRIDQNRYAIGIRGMASSFNDRTLMLINGRNAGSPAFGGADFLRLPVLMEDIDRIEVVRGPGGAAWGANAHNGAINIITKKPKDVLGLLATSTINQDGHTYSQVRYGHESGAISWRFSAGWEDVDSSDELLQSTVVLFPSNVFDSHDFRRTAILDSEIVYEASPETTFTFGAAYSNAERGDFEFVGLYPQDNEQFDMVRLFARIDHQFADGATGYLQWFGNFDDIDRPSELKLQSYENDIEGQLDFDIADTHRLTVGGNFRWTHIDTKEEAIQDFVFPDNAFNELWIGLFLMDRFEISEALTFEGQIRVDYYSETQVDWSGRATALYALDDDENHVLRLSAAKAFRAPTIAFREVSVMRTLIAPGIFATNLTGAEDMDNEQTWSIEAGYAGRFNSKLLMRLDGYFQWYDEMIGARDVSPAPLGPQFFVLDNIDGGKAWGAELELTYEGDGWNASVWYAYNDFQPDLNRQEIRAFQPARHKAGMTLRAKLPLQSTLNANYRYSTTTPTSPSGSGENAASSHRLDLTISRPICNGQGEIMLGLLDVLDKESDAVTGVGSFSEHETPGRTAFARLQLKF